VFIAEEPHYLTPRVVAFWLVPEASPSIALNHSRDDGLTMVDGLKIKEGESQ